MIKFIKENKIYKSILILTLVSMAILVCFVINKSFAQETGASIFFDLSKGNVEITESTYSGYDSSGTLLEGNHNNNNIYTINQENSDTTTTENTINLNSGSSGNIVVYLGGVNIDASDTGYDTDDGDVNSPYEFGEAPIYVNGSGKVYIVLKDETINILKSGLNRAGLEKEGQSTGLLWISCENNYDVLLNNSTLNNEELSKIMKNHSHTDCGELSAIAKSSTAYTPYYSAAGIGTAGGGKNGSATDATKGTNSLINLTIAGGKITAQGGGGKRHAAGAAGIGTGSAWGVNDISGGVENLVIISGDITAHGFSEAPANIGGGYLSGLVEIYIYGGNIDATNHVRFSKYGDPNASIINANDDARGAGIGAGGGGPGTGGIAPAYVYIYDGDINACSAYGAAIGGCGGGSGGITDMNGKSGYVYIYGGNINAITKKNGAAIGGGGSAYTTISTAQPTKRPARGGDGYVYIYGGNVVANSTNGADIGGGGSGSNYNTTTDNAPSTGGNATVYISGGILLANSGGIGGGKSNVDAGGTANITVTGGTIKTTNIGSGFSNTLGYADGSQLVVTGGSINGNIAAKLINADTPTPQTLYITEVQLYNEKDSTYKNAKVDSIGIHSMEGNTYNYGVNDVYTDEEGLLYLALPGDYYTFETRTDGGMSYIGGVESGTTSVISNENSEFHTLRVSTNSRYTLYNDINKNEQFSGVINIKKGEDYTFYLLKNDSSYTIDTYVSNGNIMQLEGNYDNLTVTSKGNNLYEYKLTNVTAETAIWFASYKSGEKKRLDIDLIPDSIKIEETSSNVFKITRGQFELNGYTGEFYINTKGQTSNHNLSVVSGSPNIMLDKLNLTPNGSGIIVTGGSPTIKYSNYDNRIESKNETPIYVGPNATLNLVSPEANSSLTLVGGADSPAISSVGILNIDKKRGFLTLQTDNNVPQIRGGEYSYSVSSGNTELFSYEPIAGTLVGYHDGTKLYSKSSLPIAQSSGTTFKATTIQLFDIEGNSMINSNGELKVTLDSSDYKLITQNGSNITNKNFVNKDSNVVTLSATNSYGKIVIYGKTITGLSAEITNNITYTHGDILSLKDLGLKITITYDDETKKTIIFGDGTSNNNIIYVNNLEELEEYVLTTIPQDGLELKSQINHGEPITVTLDGTNLTATTKDTLVVKPKVNLMGNTAPGYRVIAQIDGQEGVVTYEWQYSTEANNPTKFTSIEGASNNYWTVDNDSTKKWIRVKITSSITGDTYSKPKKVVDATINFTSDKYLIENNTDFNLIIDFLPTTSNNVIYEIIKSGNRVATITNSSRNGNLHTLPIIANTLENGEYQIRIVDEENDIDITSLNTFKIDYYTKPTNLMGANGGKLSNIIIDDSNITSTISGTWSWMEPDTELNENGNKVYKAKFTPNNRNLDGYSNIDIPIVVDNAMILNKGTININSGSITTTDGNAIYNLDGKTINIGLPSLTFSITNPFIQGEHYGIYGFGNINFYNGMIGGKTNAVFGTYNIINIRNGFTVVDGISGEYKNIYLDE